MNQTATPDSSSVTWQSPSNIALVKYWGKHGNQLPINPSISITLSQAITTTTIDYQMGTGELEVAFLFEGRPEVSFAERVKRYLLNQAKDYPVLQHLKLKISSSNTFPHSSGIASSASAFSALALGVLTVVKRLSGDDGKRDFLEESSELARLGSGSACRSVYPGYVVWGKMSTSDMYSDHFAVPAQVQVHPDLADMRDAILIVNAGQKKVGSSAGHNLMNGHPYQQARIQQAQLNMEGIHKALEKGNMEQFISIVESEALSLHALMLASDPGYLLMEQATYSIIEEVRKFRQDTAIPLCFTLDAGPNVHLLYPGAHREKIQAFIKSQLVNHCHDGRWLDDGMGEGPKELRD